MATIKYVDLTRLTQYNELIKNYINTADAKAFKTAKFDETSRTLKLFKAESPADDAVADFSVEIPETDISGLLEKLTGAVEGDVVVANADGTVKDSGVKLDDLATKSEVTALEEGAVKDNADAITKLNGDASTEGSVAKTVADAIADVEEQIGTIEDLETTNKTELVVAINEVRNSVSAGGTEAAVTITTDTTTEGMLKSYTIKQGSNVVGTIDIPKDLVVTSGSIEVNPDGQAEGTYIKLVIANQTDPLYINVGTLVDLYTAKADATQIQLTVDNSTREISAVIVDGSVDADALAENSVTTVKIADANVTLAKLSVDAKNAFDSAGSATAAETNAKTYADTLNTAMDTRVTQLETDMPEIEIVTEDEINALFTS